jgi:hypothetical protein
MSQSINPEPKKITVQLARYDQVTLGQLFADAGALNWPQDAAIVGYYIGDDSADVGVEHTRFETLDEVSLRVAAEQEWEAGREKRRMENEAAQKKHSEDMRNARISEGRARRTDKAYYAYKRLEAKYGPTENSELHAIWDDYVPTTPADGGIA